VGGIRRVFLKRELLHVSRNPGREGGVPLRGRTAEAGRRVSGNPTLTASWENANLQKSARGARRAARTEFERAFWRKRKGFINEGQKKFFHQFFL